jgi:AraC-like DNA-binding protein
MSWKDARWELPLHSKPILRALGFASLGARPVERYRLLNFWSFHLYRHHGEFVVDGKVFPIPRGSASITPPVLDLEYRLPQTFEYVWAHFTFADANTPLVPIGVVHDLGVDFEALYQAMGVAVSCHATQPARAEARLWDILWQLAERTGSVPSAGGRMHPAVEAVSRIIQQRLGKPLSVGELAEEAGVSQNHLTRLFHASFKSTVVAYIRRQRVARAHHLLTQTTLPIKAIAAEVGIPDLHFFNKAIRAGLGHSPRDVREKARANR